MDTPETHEDAGIHLGQRYTAPQASRPSSPRSVLPPSYIALPDPACSCPRAWALIRASPAL